ncbi:MAG TPA: c-type cytochrome [Rhodanobacteraceae bacterium]|nr:c-type cytochrome [Rhodanobacteraceae bacterium]
MKTIWVAILLALSLAGTAIGFAQMASPRVQSSPAEQLQHTPVSGIHIGVPAQMKNPYEGDRDAWMQGKKLFNALNCAGCHSAGGGGGMGPALSDNVWIYGGSPGQIYLSILHGRPNGMPQWGTVLPPKSIWQLVTYVETLSEPNPEFEPNTKLGVHPMPGNPPHPAGKRMPPRSPKHQRPPPRPPYPAPATTPSMRTPAAPASTTGTH